MSKGKNLLIKGLVILITLVIIFLGYRLLKLPSDTEEQEIETAKVVSIDKVDKENYTLNEENTELTKETIYFTARIASGEKADSSVKVVQTNDEIFVANSKPVQVGDNVLITYDVYSLEDNQKWAFVDYNRLPVTIWLSVLFLLLLIIIGGKKGVNTIIALLLTCLLIFMVYIPSILKGYNIYLSTILISVFVIFMSLIIINGVNKKTLCAIFGNISGVLLSGILAILFSKAMNLTGFIDEDYSMLVMLNPQNPLNLKAIVWGAVVIGSLGAIMDVAMSIASSMNELSEHMYEKSYLKMLKSGMNIGRDAIGTMTNTLILAYIGSSLAIVLLLISNIKNPLYLFNTEMIVVEILQAVVGSVGILLAVPATAMFASYIFNDKTLKKAEDANTDHKCSDSCDTNEEHL